MAKSKQSDPESSGPSGQTLFDENRPLLALHAAINALMIYWAVWGLEPFTGQPSATDKAQIDLLTAFFALVLPTSAGVLFSVIAIVAAGIPSSLAKDRWVYWCASDPVATWDFPRPGHQAFSRWVWRDPRIDPLRLLEKLKQYFPESFLATADPNSDPSAVQGIAVKLDHAKQNQRWYELFRVYERAEAVVHAHKSYLLTRDLTIMCVLYGVAALVVERYHAIMGCNVGWSGLVVAPAPGTIGLLLFLIVQFVACRAAAGNYGVMLVSNVLAEEVIEKPKQPALDNKQQIIWITRNGDGWKVILN